MHTCVNFKHLSFDLLLLSVYNYIYMLIRDIYMCIYIYPHVIHMQIQTYTHMHTWAYAHICIGIDIYIYICLFVFIFVFVYINVGLEVYMKHVYTHIGTYTCSDM